MVKKKLIGIDIFSGAGGLSLGAISSGIHIKVSIEKEINAANTFKRNHPDTQVISEDIRNLSTKDLNISTPFIIMGGPPCQGFSVSNRQTRNIENENNLLFNEFVRFVNELRPEWFLFENVEGIVSFDNGKTIITIEDEFKNLGYKVAYQVLNSSDYGVPQDRNRFIMVGNLNGIEFDFPKPQLDKVTVEDAFIDLPRLNNGDNRNKLSYSNKSSSYSRKLRRGCDSCFQNFVSRNKDFVLERYKHIKPGQNWSAIPDELMTTYKDKSRCHSGIYKRLNPKKTSVVISNYRKNMLIHPYEDRGLSVREAARLQSFPDNFIFEGSLMHIQQQIGNAVPPLMAEAIFTKIIEISKQYEKN